MLARLFFCAAPFKFYRAWELTMNMTDSEGGGESPAWFDERERLLLAPYAMFSSNSRGRVHQEPDHAYRGPFQRDRDRILHSSAYRRLSGKCKSSPGRWGTIIGRG